MSVEFRTWALAALLLSACVGLPQVSAEEQYGGLREAAARRGHERARAPDGSVASDLPLPTVRAHGGRNAAAHGAGAVASVEASAAGGAVGAGGRGARAGASGAAAPTQSVSIWLILVMTMFMAFLSGVGAMPYLFTGKLDPYWSGIANAVGCGVMLAASFDLLEESKAYSAPLVLGGIVLGVVAMAYSQAWLSKFEDVSFSDLQGADARKAMLIIGVMAAHAFGEGSGVGVSFSGPRGWAQGLLVTIAIGLHNIPEGMAVATIMVARGTPPRTALYWTLLSALPQGIVAVPSYMFVETFSSLLPIALGFAAGCMIWIVFAELIPDALETAEHGHVATAATLSAAALQVISMVIAKLERADGSVASPIQADLRVLLPDLLILAPGLLAPCAAAGLAGSLLPSLPITMGVSVGVGSWLGLAGLISSLLNHDHDPAAAGHLAKHTVLLWAAGGAAVAAAGWRALGMLGAGSSAGGSGPQRKDSGAAEDGALEGAEAGGVQLSVGDGHPLTHRHGTDGPFGGPEHAGQPGMMMPGAGQHLMGNGWVASGPPSANAGGVLAAHQLNGTAPAAAATAVHLPGLMPGGRSGGVERRNGYGPGGGASSAFDSGLGTGSDGGGRVKDYADGGSGALHCHGNCDCKDCDTNGKADLWGAPMDLLPAVDRPRECVRAALLLGAALLLATLPAAYELSAALLGHLGDTSTLLPPLILKGLVFGLGYVGVSRAVAGAPGWQVPAAAAGLLAGTCAAAVCVLLLPLPAGVVPSAEIVFDPGHVAGRLRAFAAGALLLASVGYMWPAAAHFKPRKVQLGVALGLGGAAAVTVLTAGLCAGTPYCLAPLSAAAH
ncbi:hypothetical protein HYH02_007222 [Chlamydomonas schloesseri]|uniref:Uncharacterized protein n=1 Tax=Chlamydomonas schloesseri TaxID=2026947 RepID=A0A835WHN0_9CHLO|nr:hypothetical protein HYH02_007222 [Chlamydomonas schloesseri]|eukprot:KAG2447764.1 hypothetical protein HYH02_007222 [Chlamydomonas schloesseri]